jgi:hypothetical protein
MCRLIDRVGATCYIKDHGLEAKQPTVMKFVGNFRDNDDGLLVDTESNDRQFRFQLICGDSCVFRFWNTDALVGYSCNLMPWTPPAEKPAAPPPPLLRRDAKPYAPSKSAEVGV